MISEPTSPFRRRLSLLAVAFALCCSAAIPVRSYAQASALPSAATGPEEPGGGKGKALLDQMIAALGGPAWLSRTSWVLEGQAATFYQGRPHEGVTHFMQYVRAQPFGERVVVITKVGVFIPTDKRDIAEVWTPESGYEITYKGKKELPKLEVSEFHRRRAHTLDTIVRDWLKRPGTLVTYEGQGTLDRRLVDKVSVLAPDNDSVEILLDTGSHLPLARTYRYRDDTFHDWDTDTETYDNYQSIQGIMTPMNTSRTHNGELVSQIFFTRVRYNVAIDPAIFDPDHPLNAKIK